MSYAMTMPLGVSPQMPIDVNAYIKGGESQAAQAGWQALATQQDTLNEVLGSMPDMSGIASDWGPALAAGAKAATAFAHFKNDPGKAVQYGIQTIPAILNAAGVTGTVADIAQVAAGLAPNIGKFIDGHPGPLVMAAIKSGTTYGCQQLGIPPQYGTVTVDQVGDILKYGEINNQSLQAIGGFGGAAGGAALCSLVGIPPCVGGLVGGIAGKAIGSVMGGIFHIGGGKEARDQRNKALAAAASAYAGELNSMRESLTALLLAMRETWWTGFDSIIDTISLQWTAMECNTAHVRFPLLWSGQGQVNPYFTQPYSQSLCMIPMNRNLSRGTGCLNSNGLLANVAAYGCPQPYGCPYPTFPPLGAEDQYSERVVQALAAYDIWWVPAGSNRDAIDQQWADSLAKPTDVPSDPTVAKHQGNQSWQGWLAKQSVAQNSCKSKACKNVFTKEINSTISNYQADCQNLMQVALDFDGVQAAIARIISDMCTTAGIYAAAVAVNANQSALLAGNYSQAVAAQQANSDLILQMNASFVSAQTFGRRMNTAVNYAMLLLGGGLLGAALYKGGRR